jgi:ketosteroid isomerase-like protein
MSDKSDVVRSAYEAFGRQDIPAVLEQFSSEISWDVPKSLPGGGVHRGHDEVADFFGNLADSYAELRVEPDEYLDADGRVIVRGHHHGRGNNGVEFEARFVHTWTVSDGKAAEFVEVADTAEMTPALEGT